ncbi:SusC/RagA family TonB-linked outer membrane protein [Chryseobacterium salviniae]|uniref:SusC/RagA family TonB-linked outer membrane protein n=1 Tax=Chryseobacterium salviniae TaxID=3101750 RepID=A0ABU6HNR7_9FLAO|nr:SusC/RagA family TonB-linked outer membrane protein [Chryseobacterium sp. T9W2-O]MEC3874563.1 SusC/RagA family TonB-linked outer membrane protein [Chryseobacterium sp. T9W2-O]
MKKTAISIVLLGIFCVPQISQAALPTAFVQSLRGPEKPLTEVLKKLSKTTKTKFFYSVSDLEGIFIDESNINYNSLITSLNFLKNNKLIDYTIQNNTVTIRKGAAKIVAKNDPTVKNDTLSPRESHLDEVVLVGYGKQSRKDISGSISSIKENDLKGIASGNFGDIIAGKATGIQVSTNNGTPGASPILRVRGIGTLTAGSNPLIVVDGFPLSEGSNLNSIDPNSISKIDILKDAASSAIYGSRGANGVILIETKQGKKGKLDITLDTYYGIQQRADKAKYVDAYDMAIYMKEARDNNYLSKGTNRSASDDTATRKAKGATLRELIPDYLTPYLNKQPGLTNTNWFDEVFRKAAISNTTFTILTGSEKSKLAFTGSYFDQEGIVIGTDYKKYSSNINFVTEINKNLSLGASITPSYSIGHTAESNGDASSYNFVQMAQVMYPFFAPYDSNGNLIISEQIKANTSTDGALVENPIAVAKMVNRKYAMFKTFGNAFGELKFLKDFRYKLTVGGDYTNYEYNFFDPSTVGAYRTAAPDVTKASRTEYIRKNYLIENLLTYDKRIGNHSFNAIAGQSYQQENNNQVVTTASGFPDNSITNIAGGTSFKNDITQYKWTLISYFARVSYNFSNKYNLMASYRKDGSSRFGANSKWGNFYALSLGWTVSNENFFPKNNVLNPFKLRYSIGTNGNNQIDNFGSLSLMSQVNYVFGGVLAPGYRASSAPNPNISWEESKSNNFGTDFSLFNQFLNVSADYYILDRDGLLLDVPVPQQSGYSSSLQNIGRIRNTGFEIQLSVKPIGIVKDFVYNGSINFSTNKNKVLSLAEGQNEIVTGTNNFSVTRVGGSIGEMYGYNITGVYKSQQEIDNSPHISGTLVGDYIFQDLNNDGVIDGKDKRSYGTGVPKYIIGFNNNFRYGNFELDFSLYSELGRNVYNGNEVSLSGSLEGFSIANQHFFDNRYNPETNPNGIYAMPNMNFSNNRKEARTSNIFFQNGDYLRLRSLKLAYNLPESLTSALKIKSAQIYFLGNNLLTFTSYRGQNLDANTDNVLTQGFDSGGYPISKSYSFGMNFKF